MQLYQAPATETVQELSQPKATYQGAWLGRTAPSSIAGAITLSRWMQERSKIGAAKRAEQHQERKNAKVALRSSIAVGLSMYSAIARTRGRREEKKAAEPPSPE
eukprot:1427666-Pleurochrysis_carterae.AAC.1